MVSRLVSALNTASRTRSVVGRVARASGATSWRPRNEPATTRMLAGYGRRSHHDGAAPAGDDREPPARLGRSEDVNPYSIRKLVIAGAASGALVFGVGASASATTPSTPPPGSAAPAGSAAPGGSVVGTAPCTFCELLTDANGMTLYAFEKDPAGQSTCTGDCATEWPPLFVEGGAVPAVGDLDASLFSLVPNPDGQVLAINGHALYLFDEDKARGDVKGQDVDGFYAVTPQGDLIGAGAEAEAAPEGTAAATTGT